jgi:hypothetical protein
VPLPQPHRHHDADRGGGERQRAHLVETAVAPQAAIQTGAHAETALQDDGEQDGGQQVAVELCEPVVVAQEHCERDRYHPQQAVDREVHHGQATARCIEHTVHIDRRAEGPFGHRDDRSLDSEACGGMHESY